MVLRFFFGIVRRFVALVSKKYTRVHLCDYLSHLFSIAPCWHLPCDL
jgi:hypothetical protein